MSEWTKTSEAIPAPGIPVETKIDDDKGVRNEQDLMQVASNHLWWFPDGSMYVYYTPTHWRYKEGPNDQ